jgi:hypothetical protein
MDTDRDTDSQVPLESDDVKETKLRLDRMETQVSDMHAMLSRLTAHPVPVERSVTSRTPTSRSSPVSVRLPEPRRSIPSAVRSLSFRQPSPAPRAPISATVTLPNGPEEEDEQSSSLSPKGPSRALKANPPKLFEGSSKEKAHAGMWLRKAAGWLRLTAPRENDETLITMFATVLGDSPSQWLQNLQDQEAAAGRLLTLQDVFDEFMSTYHGGVSEKLAEQQLNSLVYGKGECRDLVGLDSAFDRLALELYPGSETSKAAVSLLARIYSEAIRRGDEELWEKAMDAQPSTLDEWKVAVQNAYVIIETKKAHLLKARQEVRTTYPARPSSTSTSSFSPSYRNNNNAVQAKKVEVEEDSHDTPGDEGEEEVQKAEVSGTSRPFPRSTHERLGNHLSFTQRERLKELNKCWICMKEGHRAFFCEQKGKPGYPRKPTAQDLKA